MTNTLLEARPPMPRDAPPTGYHYEAVEQDARWITPAIGAGRCRYITGESGRKSCKRPAAASLMRGYGPRPRPWDYCEQHLYGRWIEDGKVMGWRLAENDSDV